MIHENQILVRKNTKPIVYDLYYKNTSKKKPLVIFCHGYKGFKNWGSWDLVAKQFMAANCFFVKFNFSHNGGTINNPIDFPDLNAFAENNYSKELLDLQDMIDFVLDENQLFLNEIDTTNITLIGHSRGGGIASIVASKDSRITQLITWASVSNYENRFGKFEDIAQWKVNGVRYVLNGRTKQHMPHNYQFFEDFQNNKEILNIKKAVQNFNKPYLIIHGTNDNAVSFQEALNLHAWSSNSELFEIEAANHVFGASHPWNKSILPEQLQLVVEKSIDFIKNNH